MFVLLAEGEIDTKSIQCNRDGCRSVRNGSHGREVAFPTDFILSACVLTDTLVSQSVCFSPEQFHHLLKTVGDRRDFELFQRPETDLVGFTWI